MDQTRVHILMVQIVALQKETQRLGLHDVTMHLAKAVYGLMVML